MPITNTVAVTYGLLVMQAMDIYRAAPGSLTPPAPGLSAGWTIVAYITGDDALLRKGPLQSTGRTVCYGFLAQDAAGDLVAAVRGTDGFVEWVEDGEFLPIPYAPQTALPAGQPATSVELGFWTLYASTQLISREGKPLGALAPAIVKAAGANATVMVVGHSLGSALATHLTLDLARGGLGARVSACLFASPHTGNDAFVSLFDQAVADYRLFNYILDVVPRVPLGPDYAPLPKRTVLRPETAEANIRFNLGCNHHVICYCAMLDYEGTQSATTPVPAEEKGSAACILGPETGSPTLAKQLAAALAGVVPV
jgi:triacylglycerol lipase